MAGETTLTVVGNLTRDPEVRTAGNTPLLELTIASTPRVFDRQANEWKDAETLFLDCQVWGDLAHVVAASCFRGTPVIAQVELRQESWTDKNTGAARTKIVGKVVTIGQRFHVPRGYQAPATETPAPTTSAAPATEEWWTTTPPGSGTDPDLPF